MIYGKYPVLQYVSVKYVTIVRVNVYFVNQNLNYSVIFIGPRSVVFGQPCRRYEIASTYLSTRPPDSKSAVSDYLIFNLILFETNVRTLIEFMNYGAERVRSY